MSLKVSMEKNPLLSKMMYNSYIYNFTGTGRFFTFECTGLYSHFINALFLPTDIKLEMKYC